MSYVVFGKMKHLFTGYSDNIKSPSYKLFPSASHQEIVDVSGENKLGIL